MNDDLRPSSSVVETMSNRPSANVLGVSKDFVSRLRLPIGILVILLLFGLADGRIVSVANLQNIALQTSYLAIFAMAQTLVILVRGFDLSLGFTVSLASVLAAMSMVATGHGDFAVFYGIAAGLVAGLLIGLANGLLIAGIGINPLVTTLGVANIVLAVAATVSDGFPVTGVPESFTSVFAQSRVLGIPGPTIIVVIVFVLLATMLKATVFGRQLYIVGSNPRAARAAGIRVMPVLTLAYVLCGLLAGLGAILLTARTGSGEPNLGGNLTLESIAAAVVGGVRLSGGEGGVGSAVLGAIFVTVLSNGMNLLQVDGYIQQICLGFIIVASLIISRDGAKN